MESTQEAQRETVEAPDSLANATPAVSLFYPMNEFYERAGTALPSVAKVPGPEVPEPYRTLLVHNRDMTPTLAQAYRQEMRLHILKRVVESSVFSREIILESADSGQAVVFAAIKIYLDRFAPEPRRLILEGGLPFGTILHTQHIAHASRPNAFFRVTADDTMNRALRLTGNATLYGRQSALLNASGEPLARVLEILPPSQP